MSERKGNRNVGKMLLKGTKEMERQEENKLCRKQRTFCVLFLLKYYK